MTASSFFTKPTIPQNTAVYVPVVMSESHLAI